MQSLISVSQNSPALLCLIDNGSTDTNRLVIDEFRGNVGECVLLESNRGINAALEAAWPADLSTHWEYVVVSDADMEWIMSLSIGTAFLGSTPGAGAVSYQHSPEHDIEESFESGGHLWHWKRTERGCALILRANDLQAMRPLPVEQFIDFDWWIFRNAPRALCTSARRVAVLHGGARHLGWRKGDSTWQFKELPEYDEFKK